MQRDEKRLIVGGMARLPNDLITSTPVFQAIATVSLEKGIVEDIEFAPSPALLSEKLREVLVGRSLLDDSAEILTEIEQRFFHRSKKAVIVAVKDLLREFRESRMPKVPHPADLDRSPR
jgi:Domain of unknown function (DUF3870)